MAIKPSAQRASQRYAKRGIPKIRHDRDGVGAGPLIVDVNINSTCRQLKNYNRNPFKVNNSKRRINEIERQRLQQFPALPIRISIPHSHSAILFSSVHNSGMHLELCIELAVKTITSRAKTETETENKEQPTKIEAIEYQQLEFIDHDYGDY
ncbi:hypothetical protein ACLKA6_010916 [Drosophila palustris]